MRKTLALLAVVGSLAVAGCSNSPDPAPAPASSSSATSAAPAVPPSPVTVTATAPPPPVAVTVTAPPPVTVTQPAPPPVVITAEPQQTQTGIFGLSPGLLCIDLQNMGYSRADAYLYWLYWDYPSQMDIDSNGNPCETVWPGGLLNWES